MPLRNRIRAADGSGTLTSVLQANTRASEMFDWQEYSFPPVQARRLILEVERYTLARQDKSGAGLSELQAYEE